MLCPVCNIEQVIVEWGEVGLDMCASGHGIWFDADELRHLFAAAGAPERVLSLESRLRTLSRGKGGAVRRCPRCRSKMDHVVAPGHAESVTLDRCARGHGIWFDNGELERIIDQELGADDPELGRVRSHLIQFLRPETKGKEPAP